MGSWCKKLVFQCSLQKPIERVSLILVTLASSSDFIISNVQTATSKEISISHDWLLDKL